MKIPSMASKIRMNEWFQAQLQLAPPLALDDEYSMIDDNSYHIV